MLICREVRLLLAHGEHAQAGCVLGLPLSFSVALPFLNGLSWGSSHGSGSRPVAWRSLLSGPCWVDGSFCLFTLTISDSKHPLFASWVFIQTSLRVAITETK